jgi:hypothetical protein
MAEENMLGLAVIVVIFGALAYDLASNNSMWTASVMSFADDVLREIRHLLHV